MDDSRSAAALTLAAETDPLVAVDRAVAARRAALVRIDSPFVPPADVADEAEDAGHPLATGSQLELLAPVPPPVKVTDRQARALELLEEAGWNGLHSQDLGAKVHAWQQRHTEKDPCPFCVAAGEELGKALRRKGLARQRRRERAGALMLVWTVARKLPKPRPDRNDDFPEGF